MDNFFSEAQLKQTLEKLCKARTDPLRPKHLRFNKGSDRIQPTVFLAHQDRHIAEISRKVLSGRFTFSPMMECEIPKSNGASRTISFTGLRDLLVQQALYLYVYPFVDQQLSPVAFGYRKQLSVHDAVRTIQAQIRGGAKFAYDGDFSKFFDSIDHSLLKARIDSLPIDIRAKSLLWRFCRVHRVPADEAKSHRSKGKQSAYRAVPRTIGIPQGGVLSGMLANLMLADFDNRVQQKFGGLIRYADDFVILTKSQEECAECDAIVRQAAAELKLSLNEQKTRVCVDLADALEFVGFRISSESLGIKSSNIDRFKYRVRQVVDSHELRATPRATLDSLCLRLQYKIRGPDAQQQQAIIDLGITSTPWQRSWIGFYRIVDDIEQIKRVDRWVRREISEYMWRNCRQRIRLTELQNAGLPSLVNSLYRARRPAASVPTNLANDTDNS